MPHIDLTAPITLDRKATALREQAMALRADGKRELAARADIASRHYRDASEAIAYAQSMEALITAAEAPAVQAAAA